MNVRQLGLLNILPVNHHMVSYLCTLCPEIAKAYFESYQYVKFHESEPYMYSSEYLRSVSMAEFEQSTQKIFDIKVNRILTVEDLEIMLRETAMDIKKELIRELNKCLENDAVQLKPITYIYRCPSCHTKHRSIWAPESICDGNPIIIHCSVCPATYPTTHFNFVTKE